MFTEHEKEMLKECHELMNNSKADMGVWLDYIAQQDIDGHRIFRMVLRQTRKGEWIFAISGTHIVVSQPHERAKAAVLQALRMGFDPDMFDGMV